MKTGNINLCSSGFGEAKTYLFAALFTAGNILLPQLCHMVPRGGLIFLPIYFFTLVAAYKYGWRAGMLTAVASPVVNSLLFGMPSAAVLPAILLKSVLLALTAAFVARRFGRVSLLLLTLTVLTYQVAGTLGEWAMGCTLTAALQDFRIGFPGMLLQVFGGWGVLHLLRK